MEDMTPYENLANAIILKAAKDYGHSFFLSSPL